MALIDPKNVPLNLPEAWLSDMRKGMRILFWTFLLSPFLFSLAEFFLKLGLAISRSEDNARLILAWEKWAPTIPLLVALVSLSGVWLVTRPVGEKLTAKQDLRRNLVRPSSFMMVAVFLLSAASGLSGQEAQGMLFQWLPRIITTVAVCLLLAYLADIASVLDQYPLRVVALTMASYFGAILGCDVLDLLIAGTAFGSVVLPVVAMGRLALSLVCLVGLLLVTGRLHRVLKLADRRRLSSSK